MANEFKSYSLVLYFRGTKWVSPNFSLSDSPTDVDWLDAPNSSLSIKCFSNEIPVAAQIQGPFEGFGFRLRIPYDGDKKRWLTDVDSKGHMYVMRNGQRQYEAQLLHQAVGVYVLVLERESDVDEGEYVPVLNIPVEVETEDDKLSIVNGMIDEILSFDHLPFQVLSQDKATVWGRVKMFYSDDSRQSGRDVSWSQFEALKRLVERLASLLNSIVNDGASRLGYEESFCRVRDLHGFDRSVLRQLSRKGVFSCGNPAVQALTVRSRDLVASRDIPAHRTIRTFLESCARECFSVRNRLVHDLGEVGIGDVRKHQLGLQKSELDRKVLPFFTRFLREFDSWCLDKRPVSIEDAQPAWFDIDEKYRAIYRIMLRYKMVMKGRRVESGSLANVDYRRMESGQPSTLQKKYDFIYEAWCYLRMVKAFISLGFEDLQESYYKSLVEDDIENDFFLPHEMVNRPLVARRGDITVMLYYRVRAETSSHAAFYLPPNALGVRQVLEPDYLIIFTRDGVEKNYAVILDAKAKSEMGTADRKTRDDYLLRFDINDYFHFSDHAKRPLQSWLIYLGSGNDENARIEFSPGTGSTDLEDMNKGLTFGSDAESLRGYDFSSPHAGHLRVNVKAIKDQNGIDVFDSWMLTQLRLAEKYLTR